jgi:uncharacterized protein (TIGR02284 family)
MPLKNSEVVSILKDLIEVCKDGEQGYKNAADDVKDEEIKKILLKYSEQRGIFFAQLEAVVRSLGGEVEFAGSILGILHRRWMDVKFGVAGSNTESILKECIRGEKSAIKTYEKFINHDLPENIKKTVQYQYSEINEAYEHLVKVGETLGLKLDTSRQ